MTLARGRGGCCAARPFSFPTATRRASCFANHAYPPNAQPCLVFQTLPYSLALPPFPPVLPLPQPPTWRLLRVRSRLLAFTMATLLGMNQVPTKPVSVRSHCECGEGAGVCELQGVEPIQGIA